MRREPDGGGGRSGDRTGSPGTSKQPQPQKFPPGTRQQRAQVFTDTEDPP